ncbi:MAG TPA: hypothetical protein VF718_12830 [Allosphingosinicella sp.]|jgi:hypothetical protein
MTPRLPATVALERRSSRETAVDYTALRDEGVRLAQLRSGGVWTDYNEHDPGVTILEILCYALTELGYRAGFPVEDLIAAPRDQGDAGEVLMAPAALFGCEPVTEADFRRLLIDRVHGLADSWLEPASPGLYHLRVYARPRLPGLIEDEASGEAVLRRARRAFLRHRPLCEDLASATLLQPRPVRIAGAVAIEAGADPEEVMAEILYRLGALVAPEPRRRPVAARPGASQAELMEGVTVANGLVADDELHPRRLTLDEDEIARHISAVPGVLAVHGLALAPGRPCAAADECLALDAGLASGDVPLALTVDGAGVAIDALEVRRRLEQRWEEHRRTWRTAAELARAFPDRPGRARDTASHVPLAQHFPAIYGLGRDGLAAGLPAHREALPKQLLGYLAIFERVMVDYLDRLSNLRAILSAHALDEAVLGRRLADALPQLAPLLIDGGPDADTLFGREAYGVDQQNRLLDFLLALYGEERGALIPAPRGAAGERHRRSVKRRFLLVLANASRRRGRGLDYGGSPGRRRAPGVEQRALILIGHHEESNRRRPRLRVLEQVLMRPRGTVEASSEPVEPLAISVVVHSGDPDTRDAAWRRQACEMIRAETPAHLALAIHFVDRRGWVRFKRLYRLWRGALRGGYDEAADLLSRDLRRFLAEHDEGSWHG